METESPARASRPAFVAAVTLGVAAAGFLLSQGLQPCDDAYITFRHARNIARHLRPAWNLEGPPVLGSSSPVWTLLLGGLGWLLRTDGVDALALWLNALVHGVATVLAFLVARDLSGRSLPSLLAAALVAFSSVNVFILSLGFEAGLFVVVLLAGLRLAYTGRDVLAVVLASLAPLVRPEGVLLAVLVWGVIVLRRRVRARLLAAFVVAPLLWITFATAYYGSPVPQSIRARRATPSVFHPYTGGRVELGWRLLQIVPATANMARREGASLLFSGHERVKDAPGGRFAPAWLALFGIPALVADAVRRRDASVAYLLYAPLFLVLFAWIGRVEAWYFPSFVTFGLLALFHGGRVTLDHLWAFAQRRGAAIPPVLKVLSSIALAVLLFTASRYAWTPRHPHKGAISARDPRGEMFERSERERFNGYRRVAAILNRRDPSPRTVMISEVGVFGFFYRGEVIDTVGLCTPEALAFYPPPESDIRDDQGRWLTDSNNITPTAMVRSLRPEYVVNSLAYIRNLLQPGAPFLREYTEVGRFGTAWGEPLLVYERRSGAE